MNFVLIVSAFPLSLFMPSLVIGGITAQGAYLLILFVLLLIASLSKLHVLIKVISKFYLTSILILLSFVSLLWTQSVGEGISMTVKYATSIFFIAVLLSVTKSPKDIFVFEKSIITCGIILVILSVLNKITGGYFDSAGGRLIWANTFVLLAPYMGPATYSFMVGMCALLSLANYLFSHNKKVWLFLYLLFFVAVMLAFTRISMASLLFSSLILYGMSKKNIWITYITPGFAISVAIAAVIFIAPVRDRMFFDGKKIDMTLVFTNTQEFLSHVNTSGRTTIWTGALQYFKNSNVYIGEGSGSADYWVKKYTTAKAMHCDFLRIYFDIGLVGVVLFLLSFYQLIKVSCASSRNNENRRMHYKYKTLCVSSAIFYIITLFTDNTLNYVTNFGIYLYSYIGFSLFFVLSNKSFVESSYENRINSVKVCTG